MSKPRLFETTKLHYGKYLYKLVLVNSLSPWFRTEFQKDGNLGRIKIKLDEFNEKYQRGEPLLQQVFRHERQIDEKEFLDALDIYNNLKAASDYKVRIEKWHSMCLYSNDKSLLQKISNKMRVSALEFWEPDLNNINFLLNKTNVVIVDKPTDFPYKVTFNYKRIDQNFANWLRANRDKSRVGDITLNNIEQGYAAGCYFFVRDKKLLSLVNIIVGQNISRIEKLVYKENIDKY